MGAFANRYGPIFLIAKLNFRTHSRLKVTREVSSAPSELSRDVAKVILLGGVMPYLTNFWNQFDQLFGTIFQRH